MIEYICVKILIKEKIDKRIYTCICPQIYLRSLRLDLGVPSETRSAEGIKIEV